MADSNEWPRKVPFIPNVSVQDDASIMEHMVPAKVTIGDGSFFIDKGGYQRGLFTPESNWRERVADLEAEKASLVTQVLELSGEVGRLKVHHGELRCVVCHKDFKPEISSQADPWVVLQGVYDHNAEATNMIVCNEDWGKVVAYASIEPPTIENNLIGNAYLIARDNFRQVTAEGERVMQLLFTVAYERGFNLIEFSNRFRPEEPEEVIDVSLYPVEEDEPIIVEEEVDRWEKI